MASIEYEIDTLRAIVAHEAAADPEYAIALARRALATTPRTWYWVRSRAWLYFPIAHQMAGRLDHAYAVMAEAEPEDVAEDGAVHARLALSPGFVNWMAGNLQTIRARRPMALRRARHTSVANLWVGRTIFSAPSPPAQRSTCHRGSREDHGGNALYGHTDGPHAERVRLRADSSLGARRLQSRLADPLRVTCDRAPRRSRISGGARYCRDSALRGSQTP
jgi:hypothetical protein